MKRFLIELITIAFLFVLAVFLYSKVSTDILRQKLGPSTADQIVMQFNHLNEQKDTLTTLYLGSSRFYRAIVPYIIGPNGYNFAHDNDSYNQEYYKLLYAFDRLPNLKRVVVGFDYVSFSFISGSRNYVYRNYFPKDYLRDYDDNLYNNYVVPVLNIPETLPVTIKAIFSTQKQYDLTSKGQLVYYSGNASDNDEIKREETITEIQLLYFNKIIDFCKKNNLQCVFVNMPIRDGEYKSYSKDYLEKMNDLIRGKLDKNIRYIDYSRCRELLSVELFSDIAHYNQKGAIVFSKKLGEDLQMEFK